MNDLNNIDPFELPKNEMDLKEDIQRYLNLDKENEINTNVKNEEENVKENEQEFPNDFNIEEQQLEDKQTIKKSYLKNKVRESGIREEILIGINQEIEKNIQLTYNGLLSGQFTINREKITIAELINKKKNKIQIKENLIEENIRFQKIKDIKENKDNIETKIKSLEENIKLLENNDLTRIDLNVSSGGGKEVIEDNIRRSRIKEIKNKKEILEKKLIYLDEQVQTLIKDEESNNVNKKFNLKQYLDNFEKDKKEAELREQKWKRDHEQRVKVFEEQQRKIQERLKEKVENENLSSNLKRQENYLKKLELIKNSAKIHREEVIKLSEMKEEWKNKPISDKQYLFKIAEEEFKKRQQHLQEEEKKRLDIEKAKIKQNYKPISKDEIDDFKKNYEEQRQKLLYEKEKERLLKREEIMQRNSVLPKVETQVHHKIVEEEKKLREVKEKEKMDKIYNKLKIKQFSKVIQTSMVPKIDETKKKEIEERILAEGQRPKKIENKRNGRIILRKPDPSNPKKYNWELKLNNSSLSERGNNLGPNENSVSKGIFSTSIINKSRPFTGDNKLKSSKSRSRDKKKPLEKNPDYLTEMRIKKTTLERTASNTNPQLRPKNDQKWNKMISNNKYSFLENVEQIKIKAQMLEQQAKMQEKLLQLNGGTQKNPEIGENVSNMLIDAIKAKLTILENISNKKK